MDWGFWSLSVFRGSHTVKVITSIIFATAGSYFMRFVRITPNMTIQKKRLLPRHVGFIPDGNRRWAVENGLEKEAGYDFGISPGLVLLDTCMELGIEEISIYGFTQDNTKRASIQQEHFSKACVGFA